MEREGEQRVCVMYVCRTTHVYRVHIKREREREILREREIGFR